MALGKMVPRNAGGMQTPVRRGSCFSFMSERAMRFAHSWCAAPTTREMSTTIPHPLVTAIKRRVAATLTLIWKDKKRHTSIVRAPEWRKVQVREGHSLSPSFFFSACKPFGLLLHAISFLFVFFGCLFIWLSFVSALQEFEKIVVRSATQTFTFKFFAKTAAQDDE